MQSDDSERHWKKMFTKPSAGKMWSKFRHHLPDNEDTQLLIHCQHLWCLLFHVGFNYATLFLYHSKLVFMELRFECNSISEDYSRETISSPCKHLDFKRIHYGWRKYENCRFRSTASQKILSIIVKRRAKSILNLLKISPRQSRAREGDDSVMLFISLVHIRTNLKSFHSVCTAAATRNFMQIKCDAYKWNRLLIYPKSFASPQLRSPLSLQIHLKIPFHTASLIRSVGRATCLRESRRDFFFRYVTKIRRKNCAKNLCD